MASKRSSLDQARAYHPRGRTVRDLPRPAPSVPGPVPGSVPEPDPVPPEPAPSEAAPRVRSRPGRPVRQPGDAPRRKAQPRKTQPGKAQPRRSEPRRSEPRRSATATSESRGKPARPARKRRPPRLANPRRRLRLATVLALTMLAVLGIRLVELQITDGPAAAASGLANRLQEVTLPAARGAIYDRNGAVLAHSVEARVVYADPVLVDDPRRVAEALEALLGIPASELAERMRPRLLPDGSGPSRYERLARAVEIDTAEAIMKLNLPGIRVHHDEARIVPGNDLAANIIGFIGGDLDNPRGLEGLEAHFDEVLRGVDGQRTFERGQGVTADVEIAGGYRSETPPQPGSDLHLTLDMDVQYEVQRVLAERLRAVDASFGTAVLLDARTGEVLALASYPGYNAADPLSASPEVRADAGTSRVFDPGSAHKPIVFGAALEEGVIEPGDSMVINPTIQKGDQTFSDAIWHPAGTRMSLAAMMAFSSNVGTITIADELGSETLYEYQQAFGLGEPTGIGLPGEVSGALLPPQEWSGSSYGSVPIGHSVDVTALQMAAAYAVIANDGVWTQPSLVQAVAAPDGAETPAAEPATRRVLSPETAAALRELMEAVTTVQGATGTGAAVEGYRVAGKTGTGALVVDGDYASGDVASFIGMAPAEDPRYVLAVSAHRAGTDTVTAAFQEMMGFALQHYRVPPATTEAPAFDLYP